MITLIGKLRQFAHAEYKGEKKTKLWVEHTSPRDDGQDDLALVELFLNGHIDGLKAETNIDIAVRPYPSGSKVAFQALKILNLNVKTAINA